MGNLNLDAQGWRLFLASTMTEDLDNGPDDTEALASYLVDQGWTKGLPQPKPVRPSTRSGWWVYGMGSRERAKWAWIVAEREPDRTVVVRMPGSGHDLIKRDASQLGVVALGAYPKGCQLDSGNRKSQSYMVSLTASQAMDLWDALNVRDYGDARTRAHAKEAMRRLVVGVTEGTADPR